MLGNSYIYDYRKYELGEIIENLYAEPLRVLGCVGAAPFRIKGKKAFIYRVERIELDKSAQQK